MKKLPNLERPLGGREAAAKRSLRDFGNLSSILDIVLGKLNLIKYIFQEYQTWRDLGGREAAAKRSFRDFGNGSIIASFSIALNAERPKAAEPMDHENLSSP